MNQIMVVYWSQTGNTEAMANAVAEGIRKAGKDALVTEVEAFASGKHIGLFGSYGWGDGEWMRDWQARMANAGAHVVGGEGVIARESPDEDALNQCRELGEALAAAEA